MIDSWDSDRILVHAVVYADGSIGTMSVVTRFSDGSYKVTPYTGEAAGISFSNSIAVIAPPSMFATLERVTRTVCNIPDLVATVRGHICSVATSAGCKLCVLSPAKG